MSGDNNKKEHLPLYGVGPVIVYGQYAVTAISIALTYIFDIKYLSVDFLNIPFKIIGILLIAFSIYLDLSAKIKSKLFNNVKENKLITDGIYSIVRNPVYSGAVLIVPVICWSYMTVFLIKTEEKWLKDLYGQEYAEYCKNLNRCIPWFPKRK